MVLDVTRARALSAEQMKDIRALFVDVLAARLGREKTSILDGLSAGDFRGDEEVELTHPDGSQLRFRNAFFVHDATSGYVGIFTEHLGYYFFRAFGGDLSLVMRKGGEVVGRLGGG